MRVIVEVSFVPLGVGLSLSPYVAECLKIIEGSGLKHELHSMGTNLEGGWEEVMAVVKACQDRLFEMGAPRVTTSIKVSARADRQPSMEEKVAHVRRLRQGGAPGDR